MAPRTWAPGANAPSTLTPNHVPNSAGCVRARHTRLRGARITTVFSMRSVGPALICNLLVALIVRNQIVACQVFSLEFSLFHGRCSRSKKGAEGEKRCGVIDRRMRLRAERDVMAAASGTMAVENPRHSGVEFCHRGFVAGPDKEGLPLA